ncbi:acyltransferase family protein [Microbacterium marinilacus]|uniref:Acyltransferase family protein n=1 Tax=Microbacterium marinilacus TaxID=415209 RepID=A0ABP7BA88_9MICO|nr:acyltransferase family protein [Microbacterium marinilacus]MBY0687205.1 acyltransferase [Microbacterium marinilacus]
MQSRGDTARQQGFRPDIQALRALAVLSVLLYHLWPESLPGGFVGVDVFFVISGYLITSHLVRERERTGRIAVGRFWARRAARLLPASLLVLAVTALAVLAWAPRSLWERFVAEITASALYVQNWRLVADSVDYLAAEDSASPVQHFWTLSVEEQFYVALPLLILAATLLLRRLPWRAVVVGTLAVATAASFGYGLWLTDWSAGAAYFSTFTRAWEFGIGALISFVPFAGRRVAAHGLALGGVALIVASTVLLSGEVPFPGFAALLPVVGAALIVWAGGTSFLIRAGSTPPVRLLGDVSYAVYLWHWPLIVMLPFLTGHTLTPLEKIGIAAASILLAWLSTRFVENPVRLSPRLLSGRRPLVVAAWAAGGMACVLAITVTTGAVVREEEARDRAAVADVLAAPPECLGAAAMAAGGCEARALDATSLVPAPAIAEADDANRDECWSSGDDDSLNVCTLGPETDYDRRLVVIGDSHNNAYLSAYERIAEERGWRLDVMGHAACYWTDTRTELATPQQTEACATWRGRVADYVASAEDVDAFLVTRSSGGVDADAETVDGMVSAWAARPDEGIPVLAVLDSPRLPSDTVQCIEFDPAQADARCGRPIDEVLYDDGQAEAVQRDPNATAIDLTDLFCADDVCAPTIGGVVVYRDGHHLTATYAATVAPFLAERIEAALG